MDKSIKSRAVELIFRMEKKTEDVHRFLQKELGDRYCRINFQATIEQKNGLADSRKENLDALKASAIAAITKDDKLHPEFDFKKQYDLAIKKLKTTERWDVGPEDVATRTEELKHPRKVPKMLRSVPPEEEEVPKDRKQSNPSPNPSPDPSSDSSSGLKTALKVIGGLALVVGTFFLVKKFRTKSLST